MESLKQIEEQIGEGQHDDSSLQPVSYVKLLAKKVPALSEYLSDSAYSEKAKRFDNNDAAARDYQQRFKSRAQAISWSIFIGASATAALSLAPVIKSSFGLAPDHLSSHLPMRIFSLLAGLLVFMSSGTAIYHMQMIAQLKLYEGWMENRARAEQIRLQYFQDACKDLVNNHTNNIVLLAQFCYFFKRFQLDAQGSYYLNRSRRHDSGMRRTAKLSAIGSVIVAAFAGSSGLAGFSEANLPSFAALGTIGIALGALASRIESTNQDSRNAVHYKKTAQKISNIAEKYSSVQRAILSGKNPLILLHFVNAIQEQLALEHRQWTEDADEGHVALMQFIDAEKNT
jgi:hypothetical protein